jgi:hypothetical protein
LRRFWSLKEISESCAMVCWLGDFHGLGFFCQKANLIDFYSRKHFQNIG